MDYAALILMLIIYSSIILAIAAAALAVRWGRSPSVWGPLILVSPLTFVILLAIGPAPAKAPKKSAPEAPERTYYPSWDPEHRPSFGPSAPSAQFARDYLPK
jgi:hypothetical protein